MLNKRYLGFIEFCNWIRAIVAGMEESQSTHQSQSESRMVVMEETVSENVTRVETMEAEMTSTLIGLTDIFNNAADRIGGGPVTEE